MGDGVRLRITSAPNLQIWERRDRVVPLDDGGGVDERAERRFAE